MNGDCDTKSLGVAYAEQRVSNAAVRYRLRRRTHEVLTAVETFSKRPPEAILDLGTADGCMLKSLYSQFPDARCVGVEYDPQLAALASQTSPELEIHTGDIQSLDFDDGSFDLVMATAVIEHVPDPAQVVREAKRVLRPEGIFVVTAPDPLWERLATIVGHLNEDQHHTVMNLRQLSDVIDSAGLDVVQAEKFMLSPIGMPAEFAMERVVRFLRLRFLMANQLVVAVKR